MLSLIKQILKFVSVSGKYWLVPVFAVLLTLGGMLVLAEGSAIAPFLYAIF